MVAIVMNLKRLVKLTLEAELFHKRLKPGKGF
jgi:hypothetical protein